MRLVSILGMKKRTAAYLAKNINLLSVEIVGQENSNAFAEKKGLKQKNVYNAMKGKTNTFTVLDQLCDKLGYEPWQLLYPNDDPFVLRLLRIYNQADARGREHIEIAATGVEARNPGKSQGQNEPPAQ